jgi:predicted nuclease of restriction endonuclease-like (RecB) superfamily
MRTKTRRVKDMPRASRGRTHSAAIYPVAPRRQELPGDYSEVLRAIKERVTRQRQRTVLAVNSSVVLLYWEVGCMILARQERSGWGSRIVDRLASDLREAFPDMRGFSPRNLKYMRAFASAWPDLAIVQAALAQITWYHNITLIEKLETKEHRLWYARRALEHGWSQPVLVLQIERRAHERQGRAQTNFEDTLPANDSDLAKQAFKDPYLFDFIGIGDLRRERDVEQALIDHIQRFLVELGSGFAFVGRQVHLEVGGDDFYVDLLFYHLKLRRYVVVELKAVPFEPGFVGQMNLYLSAADNLLRHDDDKPTIGLLLCRTKNEIVVEYALRDLRRPIGVAEWETKLVATLPAEMKSSLPTVEEIEEELQGLDGVDMKLGRTTVRRSP